MKLLRVDQVAEMFGLDVSTGEVPQLNFIKHGKNRCKGDS